MHWLEWFGFIAEFVIFVAVVVWELRNLRRRPYARAVFVVVVVLTLILFGSEVADLLHSQAAETDLRWFAVIFTCAAALSLATLARHGRRLLAVTALASVAAAATVGKRFLHVGQRAFTTEMGVAVLAVLSTVLLICALLVESASGLRALVQTKTDPGG